MCVVLLIVLSTIILANNSLSAQGNRGTSIPLAPKDEAEDAYVRSFPIVMGNRQNAQFIWTVPSGLGMILNHSTGSYVWRIRATDGDMQGTVTIHWIDSAGRPGQQALSYRVNNLPPTAESMLSTHDVQVNEAVTVIFSGESDPSPVDTEAGFTYLVDCGDGTPERQSRQPDGLQCQFTQAGDYTIVTYIEDKDGGRSQVSSHPVTVMDIQQEPPPLICTIPDPETDLAGEIVANNLGQVQNTSDTCSYDIGMASYYKFDEVLANQVLFDSTTTIIQPGETLELSINLPNCAIQIDLFYGDIIMSFEDGVIYGDRLLDAVHPEGLPYCTEANTVSSDDNSEVWRPSCNIADGRVNADSARDCAAPVAVYCSGGNIDILRIDSQTSTGTSWLTVNAETIEAIGIPQNEHAILLAEDNVGVYRLTTGEFQVNIWQSDPYAEGESSLYVVTWEDC